MTAITHHARRHQRWCAVLIACGLFVTGLVDAPVARAATTLTAPLPTIPDDIRVRAATGDAIWASFGSEDERVSLNGGRTWTKWGLYYDIGPATGGAGWFSYYGGDDGMAAPRPMPASGNAEVSLEWGEFWKLRALGSRAALATNGTLVSDGRTRKVSFPALPKKTSKPTHSYAFTPDSKYLVRITTTAGTRDYAGVIDVATGNSTGRLNLPRTSQHALGGATVTSLVKEKAGLKLCRQPLPSGKASCLRVTTTDARKSKATLLQSGTVSLIKDGAKSLLMVDGSTTTTVTLPASTASWGLDGKGDPKRPLVLTKDAAGDPHHLRIAADGTVSEWYTVPRVPVELWSVALTPDRVIGTYWGLPGNTPSWTRSIGTELGAAQTLAGIDDTIAASAGRWVVRDSKWRYYHYDNGRRIGRTDDRINSLSGPYALTSSGAVTLVTGKTLVKMGGEANFGSLVAERVSGAGYAVTIRDLADANAKPITARLHAKEKPHSLTYQWGDWVGTTFLTNRTRTVLVNYRTGERIARDGQLMGLGDGFAILSDDNDRWSVWVPRTGAVTALGNETGSFGLALDGNRVAYSTRTSLVVRTLSGVGTSAPRLLGVWTAGKATAKSPWKASIDLSKPVAAGQVIIRDAKGMIVRSLTTPASTSGSLRGISWNGKGTGGRNLAAGRYSWELVATASDGTGFARAVSGTKSATGWLVHG